MTRYLVVILLFTAIACQQKREGTAHHAEAEPIEPVDADPDTLRHTGHDQVTFADYAGMIPQISLPFRFSCDSGLVGPAIDYEHPVIKKYKPEGAGILGKVYQAEGSTGILYVYPADILFPIIQQYDRDGRERSKTELFELGECVGDVNYEAVTRGVITKDLALIADVEVIRCDDAGEKCDTTRRHVERIIN